MNLKAGTGVRRIKHYAYVNQNMIGKGAAGKVYQGVNEKSGEKVAIKIMEMSKIDNEVTEYLLACQKSALLTISNPYVLNAYDIIETEEQCLIITPLCDGGTLKEHITSKGKITELEGLQILVKLLRGYVAIKNKGFIHRDIKSSNVMFRNGEPVIIDFGYCEQICRKKPRMFYNVGSPSYMSPEAYFKSLYSEKSDLWSLGVILYEMLEGFTIDHGQPIDRYFSTLLKHGFALRQQISDPVKALLKSVLNPNFHERPSVQQMIQSIERVIFDGNSNQCALLLRLRHTANSELNQQENSTENGYSNKISLKKQQRKDEQLQEMLIESRYNYQQIHYQRANYYSQHDPKMNQRSLDSALDQQHENKLAFLAQPIINKPTAKHIRTSNQTLIHNHLQTHPNLKVQANFEQLGQARQQSKNHPKLPPQEMPPRPFIIHNNLHSVVHSSQQAGMLPINQGKLRHEYRSMLPVHNTQANLNRNPALTDKPGTKMFHSQIVNAESIITMEEKPAVFHLAKNEGRTGTSISQRNEKYDTFALKQSFLEHPKQGNPVIQSLIIEPPQNTLPSKSANPVFKSLIVAPSHPNVAPITVKFIHPYPSQETNSPLQNNQFYPLCHYAQNPRPPTVNTLGVQENARTLPNSIFHPLSPVANQTKLMPLNGGRCQQNQLFDNADRNFVKKVSPYFHMNSRKDHQQEFHGLLQRRSFPNWPKNQKA